MVFVSLEDDDDLPERIEDQLPDSVLVVGRIEIVRYLDEEHDAIIWSSEDSSGEPLALIEVLGMLRLTEDTAIREGFDAASA